MKLAQISIVYKVINSLWAVGVFLLIDLLIDGFIVGIPSFVLVLLAALFVLLAWHYAYWKRFDYYFKEDVLEIKSGVFSRRKREVPLKRVQNVDVVENIIQQMMGIAEISFETAGGGSTEVSLQYVSSSDVDKLRDKFQEFKEGSKHGIEVDKKRRDADLIYEIDNKEMGLLCLTSYSLAGTFAVLAGILFIYYGFDLAAWIPLDIEAYIMESIFLGIGILLVLSFLGSWFLNAVRVMLGFFDFKLYRSGNSLKYNRGLLKRYSGTIPLDKLQKMSINENLLQRVIGYASLDIETAGYAMQKRAESGSEVAIPLTQKEKIPDILSKVEGVELEDLKEIPGRAMKRYGIRYCGLAAISVFILYLLTDLSLLLVSTLAVVLFASAIAGAYLKWVHKGYKMLKGYFVTRNGFWRRNTKIVPYYRIQNIIVRSTFFQRRWGLASVTPDTAGSYLSIMKEVKASDIGEDEAKEISAKLFEELQEDLKEHRAKKS